VEPSHKKISEVNIYSLAEKLSCDSNSSIATSSLQNIYFVDKYLLMSLMCNYLLKNKLCVMNAIMKNFYM